MPDARFVVRVDPPSSGGEVESCLSDGGEVGDGVFNPLLLLLKKHL